MLARNWHDDAISPELGSFCQKFSAGGLVGVVGFIRAKFAKIDARRAAVMDTISCD